MGGDAVNTQCLAEANLVPSVGSVGDSYDNARPKRSTRIGGGNGDPALG